METLKRIINSKKAIYATVPTTINGIAALFGYDVTQPVFLVLDAFFANLLVAQMILDFKYGSASDGTIKRAAAVALFVFLGLAVGSPAYSAQNGLKSQSPQNAIFGFKQAIRPSAIGKVQYERGPRNGPGRRVHIACVARFS